VHVTGHGGAGEENNEIIMGRGLIVKWKFQGKGAGLESMASWELHKIMGKAADRRRSPEILVAQPFAEY
jgi:hypothetical protein